MIDLYRKLFDIVITKKSEQAALKERRELNNVLGLNFTSENVNA